MPTSPADHQPSPLRLQLLGPFAVTLHGHPLPRLRSPKSLWLLALLVLRRGAPVERDWLAALLWPDRDDRQGLRNSLTELRDALGAEVERLRSPSFRTLALDLTGAEVDLLAFEDAVTRGDGGSLAEAVALYRGPLLEGCTEEWVFQEREEREQVYLGALERLAAAKLASGEAGAAEGYLRRAAAVEPLRESVQRGLMQALAAQRNYAGVLACYRELRHRLLRELNTAPDAATTALFQQLREEPRRRSTGAGKERGSEGVRERGSEEEEGHVPLHARDRRHNLPAPTTALLGREALVAELRRGLEQEAVRLLTLTGPGGTGKSRLGVQVATDLLDRFADGVFFVELERLHEPQRVGAAIAQVLGVRESGNQPILEALQQHVRDQQLLLVLDNFEQLLPGASQIAALLAAAPGLKVLVTSRSALRLRGEKEFPVPPLALPPLRHEARVATVDAEAASITHYSAVQLFEQRARDVRPDFAITPANAAAVAAICHRLDGLPLAIELAAARVKVLSVAQIAERLGAPFRLLTGGSRAALPRHQTLRGLIDWSYDLLDAPERALLRRLSVFSGGWTMEAAETVCSGVQVFASSGLQVFDKRSTPDDQRASAHLNTAEVLDLLTQLVEHSLVVHEEREGIARYRMLETIREYARERAEEEPEVARVVADRHARYYLELAEAHGVRMRSRDEVPALAEVNRELDNVRAAMDWALAGRQGELCARLALVLYPPLYRQGLWQEARDRLEGGLEALAGPDGDRRALRATLHYHVASLAEDRGDLAVAKEQAAASLALRRELETPSPIADTLNFLGKLAIGEGDATAARQLLEEARRLVDDREPAIRGKILHNLGVLTASLGDAAGARRLYQQSLAEFRRADDLYAEARLLGDFGVLAQQHDQEYGEARRLYLDALAAYRQVRDCHGVAVMLNNLGELAERDGRLETAVALFLHAERVFREVHSVFVTEPVAALQRLAQQCGPEQWAELRAAAEQTTWEEALEQDWPATP